MKRQWSKSPRTLFWEKVDKTDGCWLWRGCRDQRGYGQLTVHRKKWKAHRFSFALAHGEIPEGAWVLHACDVPACVNPDHLFLGDAVANVRDSTPPGSRSRSCRAPWRACRGHAFTAANIYYWHGHRHCRACDRERARVQRIVRPRQLPTHCRQCGRPMSPQNTSSNKRCVACLREAAEHARSHVGPFSRRRQCQARCGVCGDERALLPDGSRERCGRCHARRSQQYRQRHKAH